MIFPLQSAQFNGRNSQIIFCFLVPQGSWMFYFLTRIGQSGLKKDAKCSDFKRIGNPIKYLLHLLNVGAAAAVAVAVAAASGGKFKKSYLAQCKIFKFAANQGCQMFYFSTKIGQSDRMQDLSVRTQRLQTSRYKKRVVRTMSAIHKRLCRQAFYCIKAELTTTHGNIRLAAKPSPANPEGKYGGVSFISYGFASGVRRYAMAGHAVFHPDQPP